MADLKPVYLVCGDDDAKIDAWRSRLRARAEAERGPGGLELFEAAACRPDDVAAALAMLSFEPAPRYLLVEGVETWKAAQLEPLAGSITPPPPDVVLVLVARGKPPKALCTAVERAGGEVREYAAPKPWELPRWAVERAGELGLQLEPDAAKQLVALAGQSQARLSRELEKLAVAIHPRTRVTPEDLDAHVAPDGAPQAYELADALVRGDMAASLALAEELCAREGRPAGLAFPIVRRLREVHRAAALLDRGVPEATVAKRVSRQPWLAKRVLAAAKRADRATLERAICTFAELEVEGRGGGELALDEATAFSLALARAAG